MLIDRRQFVIHTVKVLNSFLGKDSFSEKEDNPKDIALV